MSEIASKNGMSFYEDDKQLTEAMGQAVQDALRVHKLLGHPIVIWRDGKVVWLPPEQIPLKEDKAVAAPPREKAS